VRGHSFRVSFRVGQRGVSECHGTFGTPLRRLREELRGAPKCAHIADAGILDPRSHRVLERRVAVLGWRAPLRSSDLDEKVSKLAWPAEHWPVS
jgi:hypothetical protein